MTEITLTQSKKIILSSMLLSILLVFSRFLSIKLPFLVISFSFIPMMLSGIYLGPKYAAIICGLGDLIGAILFPFGAYFPGFTISMALMGLVYGIFLYKKPGEKRKDSKFLLQLIISSIIVLGGIKILLEAAFLNILYGKAYFAVIASRLVTQIIMFPFQIIIIYLLEKGLRKFVNKYLYTEEKLTVDEYLATFEKFIKNPNLSAMQFLMEKFNNPQKKLKVIHVSGTNGKGSICEMLASIFNQTEYRVGKFISPHLIKFNDGIWINNKQISDSEIDEILLPLSEAITEYNNQNKVSVKWFEAITALSIIYFAKHKCDLAIVEVGLGGTDDCTNILDGEVVAIGNVGYDHMDILGKDIKKIAEHKAGIIKQNSETVFVNQDEVIDVIKKKCKKQNSKLHLIEKSDVYNYLYNMEYQKFSYKNYKDIEINLKGKSQIYNAAEVLEIIDILQNKGYRISEKAIRDGLKQVVHRARLETLSSNPTIIFDGAHNESAIKNLKENINQYYKNSNRIYIVSILKTKDYKTIIKNLCKDEDAIFFFTSGNDKKKYVSKDKLYKEAKKYINNNIYKEELIKAINIAKAEYKDKIILIVGSFYVYKTVCEVLKND